VCATCVDFNKFQTDSTHKQAEPMAEIPILRVPILRDDEIHDAGWIKGEFVDTPEGIVCNEIYNLHKILEAQRDDTVRRVVRYIEGHLARDGNRRYMKEGDWQAVKEILLGRKDGEVGG
jgi:hypothetical protein